nr:MAG TPA: hypothetical protein [Bacteriophage sp.]
MKFALSTHFNSLNSTFKIISTSSPGIELSHPVLSHKQITYYPHHMGVLLNFTQIHREY